MGISALTPPTKPEDMVETVLEFPDNRLLIDLCGEFDRNLAQVEHQMGVHILRRGRVLEDVRAGGVVGELAMIDERPRSAAAMAGADSEAAVIDRPALLRLLRAEPVIALAIMRILARRIRAMNRRVGRS